MKASPGDVSWMRRCLVLARPWLAAAWPNPTVGACVVRDGRLLGAGVHRGPGSEHAEVAALRAAREAGHDPAGATVYVSLEPCHHQGRTPPCSRALEEAGVARVVFAVADSNPRLPGGGGAHLRRRGVRVDAGCLADLAWELNHPFFETAGGDRAHLTLKLALSFDGALAPAGADLRDPESRRVTGPRAHRRAHRLRAGARAILVGAGTVESDAPSLGVRHLPPEAVRGAGPRPVVLGSGPPLAARSLPPASLLLHGPGERTPDGVEALAVERGDGGRLSWDSVLERLRQQGLDLVLVEGGRRVAESLLRERRPQRLHFFFAPRWLGPQAPRLDLAVDLERDYRRVRTRAVGPDVETVWARRDLPRGPAEEG